MLEHWAEYSSLFLFSTIKYVIMPFFGWQTKTLNFLEIWLSCFFGAYACFNVFYWASSYFFKRAARKRKESGKKKKVFTKTNRRIVKMKRSKYGYFLVCFLCPMFLSVPLGTLIVAKFYGDRKGTFFLTSLYMFVWGAILTGFWKITDWH